MMAPNDSGLAPGPNPDAKPTQPILPDRQIRDQRKRLDNGASALPSLAEYAASGKRLAVDEDPADAVTVDRAEWNELRRLAHLWREFGARGHRHYVACDAARDRDHWAWLRSLTEDAREIAAGAWTEHDESEWRRKLREASWSISAAVDWRRRAIAHTTFEAIEELRSKPAWVAVCPICRRQSTIDHPASLLPCRDHRTAVAA